MGWSDSHLHRFHIHGKDYGVAHNGGITFSEDPDKVHLVDFALRVRERFLYEYDLYDGWEHDVVANIVRIARKARLSYDDFLYVSQQARKKLGLRRPKKERRLPHLLPETELKRFFQTIQDCGNVQHEILLKLLFYTAVRLSELVSIKVEDIDLDRHKIFIDQGKGAKDRYILFPASFRLVLKSHLRASPKIVIYSKPGSADHLHLAASSRSCRNTASGQA